MNGNEISHSWCHHLLKSTLQLLPLKCCCSLQNVLIESRCWTRPLSDQNGRVELAHSLLHCLHASCLILTAKFFPRRATWCWWHRHFVIIGKKHSDKKQPIDSVFHVNFGSLMSFPVTAVSSAAFKATHAGHFVGASGIDLCRVQHEWCWNAILLASSDVSISVVGIWTWGHWLHHPRQQLVLCNPSTPAGHVMHWTNSLGCSCSGRSSGLAVSFTWAQIWLFICPLSLRSEAMPRSQLWSIQSCRLQHPNSPTIGYAQSILTRDSQGRDSFTEDTLLSVWDQLCC